MTAQESLQDSSPDRLKDSGDEANFIPLTRFQRFYANFSRHKPAMVSGCYLLVLIVLAIFGEYLLVHDPIEVNLARAFEGPGLEYWLGTDHLGRSTLSRVVVAAAVALKAASLGVGIAIILGAPLGLLSGYFGGWWDRIAMRIVEAIIALPALLVAIAILAILGPSLTNAMIALGIANSTAFFRLMRGAALEVREKLYVDAARVIGVAAPMIVFRHVLPNVTGPLTVQTTLTFSYVLLAEAGLSFIGLGVQPPASSWGVMLSTAQNYVYHQPFMAVPPGLMIMFTVLAFNLLGDGLRDALARVDASDTGPKPDNPVRPARIDHDAADGSIERDGLLVVEALDVIFPAPRGEDLVVVSDVSFSVAAGKTVGLVGESGCGKSVTAMSIMGLLGGRGRISHGSIRLNGRELASLDESELNVFRGAEIGIIFQEPMTSLNPAFTVQDQIAETLQVHEGLSKKQAYARAVDLLDHVGIPSPAARAQEYPHQFSGGMAQRVMIAMAIACSPRLLIADEPTTALDVTIQGQVLDLLTRLQEENGMSILLITHDLGVVADMCNEAVVMYAGQVIERGPVDIVLTEPRHPYTAGLLASMPQNERRQEKLKQIPGRVPPAWAWPEGCRFHPRCPMATSDCRGDSPHLQRVESRHDSRCLRVAEMERELVW